MSADFLSTQDRSELMRRVKASGTEPELTLTRALRALGARPSKQAKDLPGKPDIAFKRQKVACFIDGELWHGAQWRRRGLPHLEAQFQGGKDPDYWTAKIHRNIQRDIQSTADLLSQGWGVIRLWESDVLADPEACARRLIDIRDGREDPSPLSLAASGTTADFFAGIGLMRLGLKGAGWRTVWANDYDATKRRLYLHNLRDERVELDDRPIQAIGPESVPEVSIMAACFPCTDLSLAGQRRGIEHGPQSSAYLHFADLLSQLEDQRPPFVILENVVGLVHSHRGADFRICLDRLADNGYRLDSVAIDARHFVPQSRPRLFVVGVREDIDDVPTITPGQLDPSDPLRPERLQLFMRANPDLPWAIRPMPALPVRATRVRDVLEDLPEDHPAWWSRERVAKIQSQVSERHLGMIEQGLESSEVVYATAFRRMRKGRSMAELRFDGIAGCLRCPKGGSAKQILVRVDREGWKVRLLTPRECSRLMGADEVKKDGTYKKGGEFRLNAEGVSNDDALFGFGDAVAPPAVSWLVRQRINPVMCELIRGRLLRL